MSPDLMYLEDIRDAADRAVIHLTGLEAETVREPWTIVNRDLPPLVEELSRYLRGFE